MAANGVVSHRWVPSNSDVSKEDVHVLAVDDSHVDRKVIERLLKISSCKVTAVDSGRRALQFLGLDGDRSSSVDFTGLKVDLIITDYCMPGMTGYELLKKIKESSTFKAVPVVIMSSENVVSRIGRCLEEGAEDFLMKPVKLSDVKRLREYMTNAKEIKGTSDINNNINNKRKTTETTELSDTSPLLLPSSSSSSSSPTSFSMATVPCSSPSSLDSPTRRLKIAISK